MIGQLDLLAPRIDPVAVEPTREVILYGASAAGVPQYAHVPAPRPKAMHTDEEWQLVLRVAEAQIRWRCWTLPHPLPLDEKPHDCVGGGSDVWYDGKGVAVGHDRRYAAWAAVLRGLRDQRNREPHIADARDLAHAYKAVETYDRYYVRDGGSVSAGDPEWRDRVAIPHLAKLRQIVVDLGGPDLTPIHTPEED